MNTPRWTRVLLRVLAPPGRADDVLGDMEEVHRRRVDDRGRVTASVLTGLETLAMAVALIGLRIRRNDPTAPRRARIGMPSGSPADPPWSNPRTPKDRRRQMRRTIEAWTRDFSHAARSLVRAPGFTLITAATLALAIGANTAIFSVINTVLLDPLAFFEPDRLVSIRGSAPGSDLPDEFGVGTEFYVQYRENASALEDLGLYDAGQTTVRSDDRVERLFVSSASPSLFSTLGVAPVLGRLPTNEDPEHTVAVISHWLWTDWFGRDPSVLGRAVMISGALRTVIGVMGPDFRFPEERISLWVHDLPTEPIRPGGFGLGLVGRLAPGADHETLTTQLATLAQRLPERFGGSPAYARIIAQHRPIVRSLEEELVGDIAGPLWVLLGTVGIVLLIACANVANLLIVRAESRRRDLAVRRALGAGRAGLVRTQMSEALLLAAMGAVGGVALAWAGVPLLVRTAPESVPRLSSVALDPTALLFTGGIAILPRAWPAFYRPSASRIPSLRAACSIRIGSGPGRTTSRAMPSWLCRPRRRWYCS